MTTYLRNHILIEKISQKDTLVLKVLVVQEGHKDGEDIVQFCGLLRKHELYLRVSKVVADHFDLLTH